MKQNYVKTIFVSLLFIQISISQEPIKRSNDITKDEIIYHIKYLSSEKFQGRRTGDKWCDSAGAYIENEFKFYGLRPIKDTYRQKYEFTASLKLGEANFLSFSNSKEKYILNKDFSPLAFSSSDKVSGKLVFVGYGISYPDSNYDDYKNIDVKDKVLLILDGTLEGKKLKSKFIKFRDNRLKAMIARDKGAKAIIIIPESDPNDQDKIPKVRFDRSTSNSGIVSLIISRKIAEEILKSSGENLAVIQDNINNSLNPKSFELNNVIVNIQTEIKEIKGYSFNVLGFIEGNDPKLKDQVIVIGAHYDHLGLGGEGSLTPEVNAVHGGADDNASGVSGVLELAQALVSEKNKLARSLLFIVFSGEEEGLLGSAYYVKNSLIPLENTITMINMDMIGRLKERKLIINGAGSAKIFGELLKKYNKDSTFILRTTDEGFSPSDNSSFYGKNIPVMMFFTDLHLDYHKPSDTWDKINTEGEKNILDLIKNVVIDLSNQPEKPVFVKAKAEPARRDMPGFKVTSGIIPQFGEQVEGVPIQGAREGSPAAKAGLKAGDVIIKLGDHTVKSLQDYTYALSEFKPGDKAIIVWKRDGKEMSSEIEFVKRQ
jgi:hypothetical protein